METFDEREQSPFLEKASLFRIFTEALVFCFAPSTRLPSTRAQAEGSSSQAGRVLRLERFPEGEKTFWTEY